MVLKQLKTVENHWKPLKTGKTVVNVRKWSKNGPQRSKRLKKVKIGHKWKSGLKKSKHVENG